MTTTAVPAPPRPAETGFNRDYTAFMRCGAGDNWMPEVESQIAAWLRKKRFDIDLRVEGDYAGGNAQVRVRRVEQGDTCDLRLSLVEDGGRTGIWTTELLAHDEPGGEDWISLSVQNSNGQFVKVPNIAKWLMEVLPLRDGSIEFTADARLLKIDDVDDLVELLADERRNGLVFVAGTSDRVAMPLGPFVAQVGRWASEVFGLAQVMVLDPSATAAFAGRVGDRLQAPPWAIRTYQPGVALDDASDSRRHRILGTERLVDQSDERTQFLLGDIARNQAANRVMPGALRQVRRRFERWENRRLVTALDTAPAQPEIAETSQSATTERIDDAGAQLALVRTILNLKEITEAGLRDIASKLLAPLVDHDRLAGLQSRIDDLQLQTWSLEDDNRALGAELEEAQFERDTAQLYVDDGDRRIRWLAGRLATFDNYGAEFEPVPEDFEESEPASFEELLDRIDEMPEVTFSGDDDEVQRVNAIDNNGAALRTAWQAVVTMRDYVRAKAAGACAKGLDDFINNTPAGYWALPSGKWAPTETKATMDSYGSERVFSLPDDLGDSEQVEMKAHFKLASIGRKHPRMHVYDCHSHAPVVCIGYIGTHLTSPQT